MSAAASVTLSATTAGIGTRLVAPGIDLRGPDVAVNTLRWLATVEPGAATGEQGSAGRGPSEGIGVVVLVTGSPASPAVAVARGSLTPDEALVVVAAGGAAPGAAGMVVDASSLEALVDVWTALVVGNRAKVSA